MLPARSKKHGSERRVAWDRRVNSDDKTRRVRGGRIEREEGREKGRENDGYDRFCVACGPRAPLFWHGGDGGRFAAAVKNRYPVHAARIRKRYTPAVR